MVDLDAAGNASHLSSRHFLIGGSEHVPDRGRAGVLADQGWYTHVSITGHVDEMREDTNLADVDRVARQYTSSPYPQRDRRRISAWIAVDGWHGWGALKDSGQQG